MSPKPVNTGKPPADTLPIDPQLLNVAAAIVAEGLPLKSEAGRRHSTALVRVDDSGRVQAYVYCERDLCEPIGDALLDAGGRVELIRILDARPVIQAWIPAAYLRAAAGLKGVEGITAPHHAYMK